jgi:chorismate synthase
MGNSFGQLFKITTFGESHGGAVGVVIDGCPSGYHLSMQEIQNWLSRRKPGQSPLTTPRGEQDEVVCLSGLQNNVTLGTPLTLVVYNKDMKKEHYEDIAAAFRPSHADYTTWIKYGIKPASGGGRSSARETIGRVAAAAVAEQILKAAMEDFSVVAYVSSVKDITARVSYDTDVTREMVEKSLVRCPDPEATVRMEQLILHAKEQGDSVGGTITCAVHGVMAGLGEPVFDKLEADLAKAMMSIPATKGFEIGSGFQGTLLFGSEHNDAFRVDQGKVRTVTNNSGGIQGGISNGELISMRIAFKPTSTIFTPQQTVTVKMQETTLKPKEGRHDPCVLPRAVPIVEAMATLVIMDHFLRQQVIISSRAAHDQGQDKDEES